MAMTLGQKITPPFIRATSTHGRIHALLTADEGAVRETACGRAHLPADDPQKRFQVGMTENCGWCEKTVVEFRENRAKNRGRKVISLLAAQEAADMGAGASA